MIAMVKIQGTAQQVYIIMAQSSLISVNCLLGDVYDIFLFNFGVIDFLLSRVEVLNLLASLYKIHHLL